VHVILVIVEMEVLVKRSTHVLLVPVILKRHVNQLDLLNISVHVGKDIKETERKNQVYQVLTHRVGVPRLIHVLLLLLHVTSMLYVKKLDLERVHVPVLLGTRVLELELDHAH